MYEIDQCFDFVQIPLNGIIIEKDSERKFWFRSLYNFKTEGLNNYEYELHIIDDGILKTIREENNKKTQLRMVNRDREKSKPGSHNIIEWKPTINPLSITGELYKKIDSSMISNFDSYGQGHVFQVVKK